jgi:hypothetical protein
MRNMPSVSSDSSVAVEMRTFHGIRPSMVRKVRAKLTMVPLPSGLSLPLPAGSHGWRGGLLIRLGPGEEGE